MLEEYENRIVYTEGKYEICEGVYVIGHTTLGLEKIGERTGMMRHENGKYIPDDFRYEQSLVFETKKGLVVFNSCSHGGADNIVREAAEAFPGQQVFAVLGGFHMFDSSDDVVHAFAKRLKQAKVEQVYTGHCTGDKGFAILKEVLGDRVKGFYPGMVIEW